MSSLVNYWGLQVVSPAPTGDGGLAIQNDLENLVTWSPKSVWSNSASPGATDDSSDDFNTGSLWLRTDTTPKQLFLCTDPTAGSAVWSPVLLNNQAITLSGDVTGSGATAIATTVAKIAGVAVGTPTGTGNIVFSASPTITGTLTAATIAASGAISTSQAGAASAPALSLTGAPFSGTGTTSTPLFYINSGAAPTTWSTAGTQFGSNAPSGFTGNHIDCHLHGGGSVFSVNSGGTITGNGNLTVSARIQSTFAASVSSGVFVTSAAPASAGTGTTNFPQWFASWGGTAVTNWSNGTNNGTVFGVNAASAFTGMVFDYHASSNTSLFGIQATGAVAIGSAQTTVNGSTSGTAVFSQPMTGASLKIVMINASALVGTAAYIYPVAFTNTPTVLGTISGIASASTTAVTLTGTTSSGVIVIIGY